LGQQVAEDLLAQGAQEILDALGDHSNSPTEE
jgi:hypothetical protein